jgi:adenylate kinase
MYAEAADITPGKILDVPIKRLNSLRRSIFKDIIAKAEKADNVIINTHATFRWRHGLFPAVDFDQMRQLNAGIYINMIDDIAALHSKLSREHPSVEHTLKDLIVWREEELICTEMLCKAVNEKALLYCLARGSEHETIETFYRLIFENRRKKAYLSFPMTHVVDMEDIKKEIDTFRLSLKKHFTCFDPADLEEAYLPHYAQKALDKKLDFLEVGKVRLHPTQVLQIERDINSQTYARDFMLIDQSDMIISFIPTLPDGRAAISSGVERELQHAHEASKEVYLIWTSQKKPSVFVTQTATQVFNSTADAIQFFRNKGYIKSDN